MSLFDEVISKAAVEGDASVKMFSEWFFETRRVVTFLNPVNYELLRRSVGSLDGIDHVFFDGMFASYWLGKLSGNSYCRMSFDYTSIAPGFFHYCSHHGMKVYILGAKDDELDAFESLLKSHYTKLNVVGKHHGYVDTGQLSNLSREIGQNEADVVICGMGCPKQEQFSVALSALLPSVSFITCGGFIHQTQTKLHYYPNWIDKYNLRSIFRLWKEPHTRRRLKYYPMFVWATLWKW